MTLTRNDLLSLEEYSSRRQDFKTQVIDHKKHRHVSLTKYARALRLIRCPQKPDQWLMTLSQR